MRENQQEDMPGVRPARAASPISSASPAPSASPPLVETTSSRGPHDESTRDGGLLPEIPQLTRRSFLMWAGSSGAMSALPATALAQSATTAPPPATIDEPGMVTVQLTVNDVAREAKVDVRTSLLDYLRENLQLTGTKKGCDHGQCGACTVHVNGRRTNACLSLVAMHDGDSITTIEGLGTPARLHPMQAAFVQHDGLQCGYCTAGQIMSATALLTEPCGRSDADVKEAMSGNICRCGAYSNIVAAIRQVRDA